jgi:hypothetical protein
MYLIMGVHHKKYAEIALLYTPISHIFGIIAIQVNQI